MRRLKFGGVLVISQIIFSIQVCNLSAGNYYVSPSGSDSNTGSISSPFKTIVKAVSKLKAGDTAFVRTGTYVESIWMGNSGSQTAPITLTAYPGETPVIDGQDKLPSSDWGYLMMLEGNYINVNGFEIKNSNINGTRLGGMGIQITGGNNKVSNLNVHHTWENGILANGDYSIIENCKVWQTCFSNSKTPGSVNWASALSAARSSKDGITTNAIIRGNIVYNNWGEGISSYESEGTLIEDNITYDNWSVNLYISDTRDNLVQRNIVYNSSNNAVGQRRPMTLGDERSDKPRSANNTIINNLLYNCDLWAFWSSCVDGSGLDNVLIAHNTLVNGQIEIGANTNDKIVNKSGYIKNNIFINENNAAYEVKGSLSNLVFSNNLWSTTPPSGLSSSGDVIGDPKLAKSGNTGAGELTADYFKILANSPAINKGIEVNNVTHDYFKQSYFGMPDIGAHEIVSSIYISSITLSGANGSSIITTNKGTLQLNASVSPLNATNKAVTWSISNKTGQAIISSSGLVTAIADGTVEAKATAKDGTGIYGNLTITISNQHDPIVEINNSPEVQNQSFQVVEEEFQSNFIGNVIATPGDSGQIITYKIISGNESELFSIDAKSGDLSIISENIFLYTPIEYQLTVEVEDNGNAPLKNSAIITINLIHAQTTQYINPANSEDLLQNGTIEHPYDSWQQVIWKNGHTYLQKKGTIGVEQKIKIGASNVTIGSYGNGEKPIIQSNASDYALWVFEKDNVNIKDIHVIATEALSCVYIIGSQENCKIENSIFESSQNAIRVIGSKSLEICYNTFANCSEAIYSNAESNKIYYNILRNNQSAININSLLSSAEIYNNVFYDNELGLSASYSELTLFNNIFHLANEGIKALMLNGDKLTSDHNIYYPEKKEFISIANKKYSTLASYQRRKLLDSNSLNLDPKFIDVLNYNFEVSNESPAINAGKTIALYYDFTGQDVPYGNGTDIGANESRINSLMPLSSAFSFSENNKSDKILTVFPNPSNGIFNIELTRIQTETAQVAVFDISGKEIYNKEYIIADGKLLQNINLTGINQGIYYLNLNTGKMLYTQKIVIK